MLNSQQPSTNEIRVSGNTHPTTLSGYIHKSLNSYSKTCIIAVGPKAISTAIKAIAVARMNINSLDKDIVALPEFTEVIMDDIKLDGGPLNSEGKEMVGKALEKAIEECDKLGCEKQQRIHAGMKIFLEQVNRVIESVKSVTDTQIRNNRSGANGNSIKSVNSELPNKKGNSKKRPMTEEELFYAHVGGNKPKTLNSNGIPRV